MLIELNLEETKTLENQGYVESNGILIFYDFENKRAFVAQTLNDWQVKLNVR